MRKAGEPSEAVIEMLLQAIERQFARERRMRADDEEIALLACGRIADLHEEAVCNADVEGQTALGGKTPRERLLRKVVANPADGRLLRELFELALADPSADRAS